jgi:hypothetical protein
MTTLLLAAAIAVQDPAGAEWGPKPPYKDGETNKYAVKMAIEDPESGATVNVEMTATYTVGKKSDKGVEGTFGWTQLLVDGSEQPDETFKTVLKPNGVLKSVDSVYGPGMRRMLLPFYLAYPEKPVQVGGSWTYKDEQTDETEAHKAVFEYTLSGTEQLKSKKAQKVNVKFSEVGPSPLKGEGTYWVGEDGRVLKFEFNVSGWTVPVAGMVFTAKISGELA